MSTSFQLLLPRQFYEAMILQAQTEAPNECCGLLAGIILTRGTERLGEVRRHYPLVNAAASPTEYLSEPRSMFKAVRDLTRAGLEILAVYHSHPTSAPVPSKTDRERNYSTEVMNLIVSLENKEPTVAAWWLTDQGHLAAEWKFVDLPDDESPLGRQKATS